MSPRENSVMDDCRLVQKLFKDAWPKREPPLPQHCYSMALRFDVVRSWQRQIIPVRHGDHPRQRDVHPLPKYSADLIAAANNFLRKMETAKLETETTLQEYGLLDPQAVKFVGANPFLIEMEAAKEHALKIIDFCTQPKRDPVNFIADGALETWRNVLNEDRGASRKPGDPLCRFTQAALKACGINYTKNSVSDLLRGRENRPRSGKKREVT